MRSCKLRETDRWRAGGRWFDTNAPNATAPHTCIVNRLGVVADGSQVTKRLAHGRLKIFCSPATSVTAILGLCTHLFVWYNEHSDL